MRITSTQLRRLIKEELRRLHEMGGRPGRQRGVGTYDSHELEMALMDGSKLAIQSFLDGALDYHQGDLRAVEETINDAMDQCDPCPPKAQAAVDEWLASA
jgi:hypothetical protein